MLIAPREPKPLDEEACWMRSSYQRERAEFHRSYLSPIKGRWTIGNPQWRSGESNGVVIIALGSVIRELYIAVRYHHQDVFDEAVPLDSGRGSE
jgi:hypothetical protein